MTALSHDSQSDLAVTPWTMFASLNSIPITPRTFGRVVRFPCALVAEISGLVFNPDGLPFRCTSGCANP
jgi:hypothetical protein